MAGEGNARGNLNHPFLGDFATVAAALVYANAFGYLREGVYFWDTTYHFYRIYDGTTWHQWQPVLGLDGSIATVAALNATYPPGVAYRNFMAWVNGGAGVGSFLYGCFQTPAGVWIWDLIKNPTGAGVFFNYTNPTLDGTLVTVLPNGTITQSLRYVGHMAHSGGVSLGPDGVILLGGAAQTIDFGGGNIVTITVTGAGAVTLQLTAGAGTVGVQLMLMGM